MSGRGTWWNGLGRGRMRQNKPELLQREQGSSTARRRNGIHESDQSERLSGQSELGGDSSQSL